MQIKGCSHRRFHLDYITLMVSGAMHKYKVTVAQFFYPLISPFLGPSILLSVFFAAPFTSTAILGIITKVPYVRD